MNNKERLAFWRVLSKLSADSKDSTDALEKVITPPERLCRFRKVNETSLLNLQNNTMFYSSADYYDDPFDTYFYFDRNYIAQIVSKLQSLSEAKDGEGIWKLICSLDLEREEFRQKICKGGYVPSVRLTESGHDRIESIRLSVLRNLFSICFCADPKNEVLWLKYGDCHRGFVQIYDTSSIMNKNQLGPYPIYYSDEKYDASGYVVKIAALNIVSPDVYHANLGIRKRIQDSLTWELERICLIKKECHQTDDEWRIIYPTVPSERPSENIRPNSIALGLRMPEYKRRLVISAAKIAGISSINEIYIDEAGNLDMRPINISLY